MTLTEVEEELKTAKGFRKVDLIKHKKKLLKERWKNGTKAVD